MIRKSVCFFMTSIVLLACNYDKEALLYPDTDNCNTTPAGFAAQVQPLVQNRCALSGCHDAASVNSGGPLTSLMEIKAKAAIIRVQVSNRSMPQGTALSAAEIQRIVCWIDAGAPDN